MAGVSAAAFAYATPRAAMVNGTKGTAFSLRLNHATMRAVTDFGRRRVKLSREARQISEYRCVHRRPTACLCCQHVRTNRFLPLCDQAMCLRRADHVPASCKRCAGCRIM